MVTVFRDGSLRIVIYLNDHHPAHVHAFSAGGEAKINLLGNADTPELVWADHLTRGEIRRIMRTVAEHHATLIQRWNDIHG